MTGDCHVRFCERLRGETPLCLLGENKKKKNSSQSREGAKNWELFLCGLSAGADR